MDLVTVFIKSVFVLEWRSFHHHHLETTSLNPGDTTTTIAGKVNMTWGGGHSVCPGNTTCKKGIHPGLQSVTHTHTFNHS